MMSRTIVEYFSQRDAHHCGYCKSEEGNISHGMWAHVLNPSDYQCLIDRGWRRSGKYCYKPVMSETCCPQYTIKVPVMAFQKSRRQKKVLKKFRNFIIHGEKGSGKSDAISQSREEDITQSTANDQDGIVDRINAAASKAKLKASLEATKVLASAADRPSDPEARAMDLSKSPSSEPCASEPQREPPKKGLGADPSKPHPKKAKEIRRERARLKGKVVIPGKQRDAEKSVEDLVYEAFPETAAHRFEVRTVHAQSAASAVFRQTFDESYAVYVKYQVAVHGDAPSKCSKSTFRNFLCDSSLEEETLPTTRSRSGLNGLGPYHQQYCIDGRIVAVGVVDVLPNCVSSVYLYYDPDYAFLSFGTLSSLFEIAFARDLHRSWPELQHYYMGFYIHSCPKMRYKAQYHPSLLLCPEEYTWHDVQSCLPLLDAAKYSRLSPESPAKPDPASSIEEVLVLYKRNVMPFGMFRELKSSVKRASGADAQEDNEVTEYVKLVGGPLSRNMVLYRE